MKIAVTHENGMIFQHFGHTEEFKVYDTDSEKIISSSVINTLGSGHGALAGFLKDIGADAVICGGIGAGAKNALADAGITLYGGCSGPADEAVEAFLSGRLAYNSEASCSHHLGGSGEHNCGNHSCG